MYKIKTLLIVTLLVSTIMFNVDKRKQKVKCGTYINVTQDKL